MGNSKRELWTWTLNFIDNNIYIITKLLAPATSKMTNRGGGKGYTLTTREKLKREGSLILKESMNKNWNFQRDEKVQTKNPSMGVVGYPWILSGTKHFQ